MGILSLVFLGSFMENPEYLNSIAANESKVVIGALFILTVGFALTMVPVFLYPLFKKYNETLALGDVVFRGALEAVVYMAQAILWLLLLSTSQNFIVAGSADLTVLQNLSALFIAADAWITHILSIVFSLGALMIYWVFCSSKLFPRWVSVWGLVGGILYFADPIAGLMEVAPKRSLRGFRLNSNLIHCRKNIITL